MKEVKGVLGIVFSRKKNEFFFLILHRVLNWQGWEFPKGRIDGKEKEENALTRELEEETGLKKIKVLKKVNARLNFSTGKEWRTNNVYLVQADMNEEINLLQEIIEHDSFKWAKENEVLKLLSFENQKEVFAKALIEIKKLFN